MYGHNHPLYYVADDLAKSTREVRESDALKAIDGQVRSDWLTLELGKRSPHSIIGDVIDYMSDAEVLALLKSVAAHPGVDALIANELACEANRRINAPTVCPACLGKGGTAPNGTTFCNCDDEAEAA